MKKIVLLAAVFLISACSTPTNESPLPGPSKKNVGGAETVENGGSVTVEGESYKLTDLSFKKVEGDIFLPDEKLIKAFQSLRDGVSKWLNLTAAGSFRNYFDVELLSGKISFRLVGALPTFCQSQEEVGVQGAIPFACTSGGTTWIIPKYYSKLSFEEKVGAFVHERLHSHFPSATHDDIMPFVRGLVAFQMIAGKTTSFEKCAVISPSELWDLHSMLYAMRSLFDENIDLLIKEYHIWPKGGAMVGKTSRIDPKNCLAIGSYIDRGAELGANNFVFDSTLERNPRLGRGNFVTRSSLTSVELGNDCKVVDTKVNGFKMGTRIVLQESSLNELVQAMEVCEVGDDVKVIKSTIRAWTQARVGKLTEIRNSRLESGRQLVVGENLNINSLTLSSQEDLTVSENYPGVNKGD